ncbi:MAG TPA: FlgD immunoglobulin-like domain containing protein [Pseudodesulfovibrio sp.]|nr:FlgD immunoglobulin-like domain containing protein [Pseudodesulfovibrio sp.]
MTQITGDVWAVGDGPLTRIFDGAISVFYVPLDQSEVSVGPTRPFDNAPGGSRASMAQADSTAAPYGDIVALHPSHCFIPTISALALETTDLFYDVAGDPDLLSKSAFDALYYPLVNEEHVAVTPQNAQWIKDEIFSSPTAAPEASRPASMAVLYPSVPNPFNPRTTLSFDLARSSRVRLRVYDAAGRLVRVLADRPYAAGRHRVVWDGRDIKGRPAASGVYFPRLDAGGESQAVKVLLVK